MIVIPDYLNDYEIITKENTKILWLDYRKKDINKIGIYVTLTSDNNDIKEIMFDFSEIDKRSPFYTIYYSNYNNVNVKIPSNVLAKLF